MTYPLIEGNLKALPAVEKGKKDFTNTLRCWTIGGVGEVISFWGLHKAKFWRIVKPIMFQGCLINGLAFVSPNQIRQGLCLLPNSDERYYRKRLTDEQIKLTYRWDFLALKPKGPFLIEIKTQSAIEPHDDYRLFKKRDFSKEKQAGFSVLCLRIVLRADWQFEVLFEEL